MQITITMQQGREATERRVFLQVELPDTLGPTERESAIKTVAGAAERLWAQGVPTTPKCQRCGGSGVTLDANYKEARCGECLGGGRA